MQARVGVPPEALGQLQTAHLRASRYGGHPSPAVMSEGGLPSVALGQLETAHLRASRYGGHPSPVFMSEGGLPSVALGQLETAHLRASRYGGHPSPAVMSEGGLPSVALRQIQKAHLRASRYGGHPSPAFMSEGWRRRPDLNRGWRFCRPLPYHLATAPIGDDVAGRPNTASYQPPTGRSRTCRVRGGARGNPPRQPWYDRGSGRAGITQW